MPESRRRAALCLCVLFVLAVVPVAHVGSAQLPDPNNVGPYAIGHVSLTYMAPQRTWDAGERPLPVEVFYPVDPGMVTTATPQARLPARPDQRSLAGHGIRRLGAVRVRPCLRRTTPSAEEAFPRRLLPGLGCHDLVPNFLAGRSPATGSFVAVIYHYV